MRPGTAPSRDFENHCRVSHGRIHYQRVRIHRAMSHGSRMRGPDGTQGASPVAPLKRAAPFEVDSAAPAKRPALPGGPIPLIELSEDGGPNTDMRISAEARRILQEAGERSGRPVMVVCVVGRSRTGKSFLLNRGLMNTCSGGFTVSPSTRACTKGLWIAGPPVPAAEFWANLGVSPPARTSVAAAGEDYDVLVVDTEGINALDRDQSYDVRIFTLALLLSSVFVYNSLGAIDENAISTLSAVASVAESLKAQNGKAAAAGYGSRGRGGTAQPSPLELPSLLWVVRDFALDIEREGALDDEREVLSDDEYLEEALRADMFSPASSKGMLRKVLNDAFPCRACQTMVRPAKREEDLKRLQELDDAELRPEFVAQLASLRSKLFALARPKRVAGRPVDASLLADLVASYVEAINGDRAPVVADAWTQVTRARCEKGVSQAVSYVEGLMSDAGDRQLHPAIFHAHITYGLRTAEALYRQHIRGVPDTAEFDRQLQQRLLVAVASSVHRAKDVQAELLGKVADAAAERWREQEGAAGPVPSANSASGFLARALGAARAAAEQLVPVARLPPAEYSADVVPPMIEDAPRKAAEGPSQVDRWAWLAAMRLAEAPELLAARGIALPETGVPAAEHELLRQEAERLQQRAGEAERLLDEERARMKDLERRAAEADTSAQVAQERAAAAEASAETRVSKLQESLRLGGENELAAHVAEIEARAEAKLRDTIDSYEKDLDEREEALEASRSKVAALQGDLAEALRVQAELRDKLSEGARKAEAAALRHKALEADVARAADALAARTAEVQRLTNEHGCERLEWATRLRKSETEAARASGQAEALAARVKTLDALHAQLEETRRALHTTEIALTRADAERKAAEVERDRAREILTRKEDELRDSLRTVKEISRTLKARA